MAKGEKCNKVDDSSLGLFYNNNNVNFEQEGKRYEVFVNFVSFLPSGASHKRHAAAMAPAEAPDAFFRYKSGAYLKIGVFQT